jgi:hypothetical protein
MEKIMTDTKKLREAAGKLNPIAWDKDWNFYILETDADIKADLISVPLTRQDIRFYADIGQTVLSLLDEIEQLKGTIECDRGAMRLEIERADNNFDACELLAGEVKQFQEQLRQAKDELDAARGAVEMLYAAAERHSIKRGLDDDHPLREAISHPTVQAARVK